MNNFLEHLVTYKFLYIVILVLIILVTILLIILKRKNKKVEPITIEEIDSKEEKSDLEEMIAAMENSLNDREMTTFEQEQEDNAIISYQELVAAVNEKKAQIIKPEIIEAKEEKIELPETIIEPEEVMIEEILNEKKFKNSEFISPVFGKDNNDSNDDFLKELKDFRKNL